MTPARLLCYGVVLVGVLLAGCAQHPDHFTDRAPVGSQQLRPVLR